MAWKRSVVGTLQSTPSLTRWGLFDMEPAGADNPEGAGICTMLFVLGQRRRTVVPRPGTLATLLFMTQLSNWWGLHGGQPEPPAWLAAPESGVLKMKPGGTRPAIFSECPAGAGTGWGWSGRSGSD